MAGHRWRRQPAPGLLAGTLLLGALSACGQDGTAWRTRELASWPACYTEGRVPLLSGPDLQIAAAGRGFAAAWIQCEGSRTNVWTSRCQSGDWTAPQPVGTSTADRYPALAINASGESTALWVSGGVSGGGPMWEARLSPSRGWSAPAQIDAGSGSSTRFPRVFMRADGDVVAAWSERADPLSLLRARRRVGGRWEDHEALPVDVAAGSFHPLLDADAYGNVRAVWADGRGSWTARYRFGAGWAAPDLVEPRGGAGALDVSGNGDALVAWLGAAGVLVQRFERDTGWQPPERVHLGSSAIDTVSVALGRLGGVVAWGGSGPTGPAVWGSRRPSNGSWESARLLGPGYFPTASIDDAGHGLVGWTDTVGDVDHARLVAVTFSPAAGWGPAETIGSVPMRHVDRAVAIDAGVGVVLFADHPMPTVPPDVVTLTAAFTAPCGP